MVRIPAGPLGSLKCDPPKGNGRRQKKIETISNVSKTVSNKFILLRKRVDPVMSVPFVQRSLFQQQQMPVGNMEPMNVRMAQMNQMMQTMSSFQSEVSNRLAVLERRENLHSTV